jgi:uncharacterized protein with HEPN domain
MSIQRAHLAYLEDMLDAIDKIKEFTQGSIWRLFGRRYRKMYRLWNPLFAAF